jgi:hypothetical protein
MAYSEFSEFSYGFALTHEMAAAEPLAIAPVFPSLLAEGGPGGGWDVHLDKPARPLYLQFKRSQHIRRASGKEAKRAKVLGVGLTAPYHRFAVTDSTLSNQHKMLLELDNGDQDVFYVAPRFSRIADLNAHWLSSAVEAHSVFVKPQDIGTLAAGPHNVAFTPAGTWCFSEPRPVTAVPPDDLREKLRLRLEADPRPLRQTVVEFSVRLQAAERRGRERLRPRRRSDQSDQLVENLKAAVISTANPSDDAVRDLLNAMAQTALGVFDAQLVLVQPALPKP